MQDSKFETRGGAIEQCMIWKAVVAVAIGALLGALAQLPYDRLVGASGLACATLRSWIAIVALTHLSAR